MLYASRIWRKIESRVWKENARPKGSSLWLFLLVLFAFRDFCSGWTIAGDANATCADGMSRAGVAKGMDKIVDKDQRLTLGQDLNMVRDASLARQRVHALWDARAERAANDSVARAAIQADQRRSHSRRGGRRRHHRRAAIRTPVVLLSAPRPRCCTSIPFPRNPSLTFFDHPTIPMPVDPDCLGTFGSTPCPLRSLSSAAIYASQMCTRDPSHSPPTASPESPLTSTTRTPAMLPAPTNTKLYSFFSSIILFTINTF